MTKEVEYIEYFVSKNIYVEEWNFHADDKCVASFGILEPAKKTTSSCKINT